MTHKLRSKSVIRMSRRLLGGVALAALLAVTGGTSFGAEPFTLVMLPDTQHAVQLKPEVYYAQLDWIEANRDSLDIPFVIHVGDLVHHPSNDLEWQVGRAGFATIDGKVDYQIAVGNHDMDDVQQHRGADTFNSYFPLSLFQSMPSFGGNHPEDHSDNTYFLFTRGGVDWLTLALKYQPTPEELAWADLVVACHPDRLVIINSHQYQQGIGPLAQRTATGDLIWNEVARTYPNVRFVFSGHHISQGMIVSQGDHGNNVYQIQADYQNSSNADYNGYLRIMTVKTAEGRLDVRTHNPYCAENLCLLAPPDLIYPWDQFTVTGIDYSPGTGGPPPPESCDTLD